MQLRGIHIETLGHYLSALGLLRVLADAKRWPNIRGYWQYGFFNLISSHDDLDGESLSEHLLEKWSPTPFERWWKKAQEASKKDSLAVPKLRAGVPDDRVNLLDAVMIQADRRIFNDLFGSGGNIGKRDLARVWKTCWKRAKSEKGRHWLNYTLFGNETVDLPTIRGTATWFGFANKTFNSGQGWFREGRLSPWSFLLAMEGSQLFRGSVHRRLGARSRGKAVFPFVCRPKAPLTIGEVGHHHSELWAPIWQKPTTWTEVEAVFRTGLAELDGNPASAPHEFAVAALRAGVDAGISEFVRFELRQTTSSQVFEAVPCNLVRVASARNRDHSRLLTPLINSGWLGRLPSDPNDPKQRGKFKGFRGPVESVIVHLAEEPDDPLRWRTLLGEIARAQQRVDRNTHLRERCLPVPGLSPQWVDRAWPDPPLEIRVARAIGSIQARSQPRETASRGSEPILVNIFGVDVPISGKRWFPKVRPNRTVWHEGAVTRAMIDILLRRLVDAGNFARHPLYAQRCCRLSDIAGFLAGPSCFDDFLLSMWLPPLALIEWRAPTPQIDNSEDDSNVPLSSLYTLLRPLFTGDGPEAFVKAAAGHGPFSWTGRHATALRRIVNLLLQNQLDEVVAYARSRYLACGWKVFDLPRTELEVDVERLTAALLIPSDPSDVLTRFKQDWLIASEPRQ